MIGDPFGEFADKFAETARARAKAARMRPRLPSRCSRREGLSTTAALVAAAVVATPARTPAAPAAVGASADARELLSGLLAGAVQKTAKELVLHPLDTVKTRLQIAAPSTRRDLFVDLYSGITPAVASGATTNHRTRADPATARQCWPRAMCLPGAPAASVFFAIKDYVQQSCRYRHNNSSTSTTSPAGISAPSLFGRSSLGLSRETSTLLAVLAANGPYWLVRNPLEARTQP